jgi:hypothetical protein
MKAEDFAAWLSAISGMNEGQRTEAIAALEKASAVGAEGRGSAKKAGKRGRQKDALGTTSHERVAAAQLRGLGQALALDHRPGVIEPFLLLAQMRHRRLGRREA